MIDDFISGEYSKIQDYVINFGLYVNQPSHLSHADILIQHSKERKILIDGLNLIKLELNKIKVK